ncbi:SNARE associated Golgi protein [Coleofasciculus chthonoplastes PCC 7420]|uniref:TVP38/TMEM64 family membrane protein n=1 Tax=Coleofasciculus chthonoplastes PCC 7420 TaxID=118168 RepID=B4VJG3_9CYAN|nr:TVP38/TMEM64 family protein [Coleofasciculus chthonoplastes]EDX78021.1 SNARE associated Golgi protein [Coleofasciculus chthonoplastes PCC 7420]
MAQLSKYRLNSKLKLVLIGGVVVLLIIATKHFDLRELLQAFLLWVDSLGVLAPIVYMIIYNVATLLFIPGSLLTLKGGCLFGLFWGSIYVTIAAMFGAIFAFLIGRYLSRDWVCKQIESNDKFKAINQAVKTEGWKIVLLTRLSPIFPFNLLNYVFGVTQVSLKDYVLGSIGMIPATLVYVYIGSLASNLATVNMSNQPTTQETQIAKWVIRIIGLIATIAVTVYLTYLAKKALAETVVQEEV